jgi:hypothetical protein
MLLRHPPTRHDSYWWSKLGCSNNKRIVCGKRTICLLICPLTLLFVYISTLASFVVIGHGDESSMNNKIIPTTIQQKPILSNNIEIKPAGATTTTTTITITDSSSLIFNRKGNIFFFHQNEVRVRIGALIPPPLPTTIQDQNKPHSFYFEVESHGRPLIGFTQDRVLGYDTCIVWFTLPSEPDEFIVRVTETGEAKPRAFAGISLQQQSKSTLSSGQGCSEINKENIYCGCGLFSTQCENDLITCPSCESLYRDCQPHTSIGHHHQQQQQPTAEFLQEQDAYIDPTDEQEEQPPPEQQQHSENEQQPVITTTTTNIANPEQQNQHLTTPDNPSVQPPPSDTIPSPIVIETKQQPDVKFSDQFRLSTLSPVPNNDNNNIATIITSTPAKQPEKITINENINDPLPLDFSLATKYYESVPPDTRISNNPHNKLCIIVPFRDGCSAGNQGAGREANLAEFRSIVTNHLAKVNPTLDYVIIVSEQIKKGVFNKGALFNAGFLAGVTLKCTYVVLHDVDQVPISDSNTYNLGRTPLHMCTATSQFGYRPAYETMVGGALMMTLTDYVKVNGFSNLMDGWGLEDDDMFNRIVKSPGMRLSHLTAVEGRYRALDHPRVKDLDVLPYFEEKRKLTLNSDFSDGLNTISKRSTFVKVTEKSDRYVRFLVEVRERDLSPPKDC